MTGQLVSVTEASLAQQFVAYDASTWPMQQALARNLWAGSQEAKKREGITQHAFLSRVVAEIAKLGSARTVQGLWPYLYTGCALDAGFTPAHRTEGELIGQALDRLGLTPDIVRGHLDAGNLAQVVAGSRAATTTRRITTEAADTLDAAAERARALLGTEAMSEPEIRAILPLAYKNASPQVQDFLLRLGNGDVDLSKTYVIEADEGKPNAPLKAAAPPVSFVAWLKLNAPCWICGRTPHESGFPHDAHHVQSGEHESRPADDTEVLWAAVCRACHVPQPFSHTNTAHSSEYALHFDAHKLHDYLRYLARLVRLYEIAIGAR